MRKKKMQPPPFMISEEIVADLTDAMDTVERLDDLEDNLALAFKRLELYCRRFAIVVYLFGLFLSLLASVLLVLFAAAFFRWYVPVILGVVLALLLVVLTISGGALTMATGSLVQYPAGEEESESEEAADN